MEKDRLIPAMVRWEGQYSDQLLETIDWCLCLNHMYRPQSVFALQKALTSTALRDSLGKLSARAGEGDREAFSAFIATEQKKWADLIESAKIEKQN